MSRVTLSNEHLLKAYSEMVRSRLVDEKSIVLYKQNKCHFQIGVAGHEASGEAAGKMRLSNVAERAEAFVLLSVLATTSVHAADPIVGRWAAAPSFWCRTRVSWGRGPPARVRGGRRARPGRP